MKDSIITQELRERMMDVQSNWKVRTDTIDEIANLIQLKLNEDPMIVLRLAESLMEFLV